MDIEEIKALVIQAQEGDLEAYAALVRQFQDMAVGYAYSLLGDFHLAEDAAQEAFVGLYLDLHRLREPAAFLGWFRRIIAMRCSRYTRRKQIPTLPLEDVGEIIASHPDPAEVVETQELRDKILASIQALPEMQRAVMTLFYINEYRQKEISTFLDVPVSTVKNSLRSGRDQLHVRMMDMVKENLGEQRPSRNEKFEIKVMNDLMQLSDQDLETLLNKVRNRDLALAMQQADDRVIDRILDNMSPGYADLADFRMLQYRAGKKDQSQARERILKKATEIVQQTEPAEKEAESAAVQTIQDKLQRTVFSAMTLKKKAELFVDMASVVQTEGILALESIDPHIQQNRGVPDEMHEGLLVTGLRLAIDGHEPALVSEILEVNARALHQQYETRCLVVLDGLVGIPSQQNVLITRLKMEIRYADDLKNLDDGGRFGRLKQSLGVTRLSELGTPDKFADAIHASLHSRLQENPFSTMNVHEVCHFFCDALVLERLRGLSALKEIPDAVDEAFPKEGWCLVLESSDPKLIQKSLEGRMQTLLHQQEIGYRMIITGIEAMQMKEDPRIVEKKMRGLYET